MFLQIKKKVLSIFWPAGSVANIIRGPLKGFKFVMSENSGWSPIVGRWEPMAQRLFEKIIGLNSVVYDLGANNGIHALLFAKIVGTSGKVYCFEPLLTNCAEIKNNAGINNISNINIVQSAVGKETGSTTFRLGLHDKQGSLIGIGCESGANVDVNIITLDTFIEQGNPAPDFIKIDIEGAESMALHGFKTNVDRFLPLLFIELHTPEQDKLVGQFLFEHGYIAYRVKDDSYTSKIDIDCMELIEDLSKPYPNPTGIWGTILCVHHSKIDLLKKLFI